jgi:hypothetical protein
VLVSAPRDGLKSFCDCGLCFGHALGLERGTRWGLTAEEILVSNDTPPSHKNREKGGAPQNGIGLNGWGRSANLLIHSQNHFCPAVEMHIVALRADD